MASPTTQTMERQMIFLFVLGLQKYFNLTQQTKPHSHCLYLRTGKNWYGPPKKQPSPLKSFGKAFKPGVPNFFSVAGHFHMRKLTAGHKRFCDVTLSDCDVTNPLILRSFMR